MAQVKVCAENDVPENGAKIVSVQDKEIAIFNVNGELFAVNNTCPHMGGPLGEGSLDGNIVTCPWHGWQFDVTTGTSTQSSDVKCGSIPIEIKGDDVFVDI